MNYADIFQAGSLVWPLTLVTVDRTAWRCQASLCGPAEHVDSLVQHPNGKTKFPSPLLDSEGLAVMREPMVVPFVVRLKKRIRPMAILGSVISFGIDAIKAGLGWAVSHVLQKCRKGTPTSANLNALGPVPFPRGMGWVCATPQHLRPCPIKSVIALAMSAGHVSHVFGLVASAGLGGAVAKGSTPNNRLFSTGTKALPVREFFPFGRHPNVGEVKDREATGFYSRQINEVPCTFHLAIYGHIMQTAIQ